MPASPPVHGGGGSWRAQLASGFHRRLRGGGGGGATLPRSAACCPTAQADAAMAQQLEATILDILSRRAPGATC
jgi:hypothetical protein